MALTGAPAQATTISDVFELDGNPTASAALAGDDWQTLLGSGVGTNGFKAKTTVPIADSDSPTDKSYYTGGGSKDVRDITQWQHSDGDVAPDKDEILNAFAAAYLKDTTSNLPGDELIVTFGSDRFSNGGDAQMGFWFFKNSITLNANGHFNGAHQNGDVLVLSDFSGGGKISTISVYKWFNGGLVALNVGSGSVDCRDANPNPRVCAIENNTSVPTVWPYVPKAGSANNYPTGSFLEGAINISEILGSTDDECFASFLAETRSSTSASAQLKDFALGRFPICEPTTTMTGSPTVANPSVIISGDSQTFTFTESNDGDLVLSNVSLSLTPNNTSCGASLTTPASGDANSNSKLDPGETWTFTCSLTNVTSDTTLTAVGHGTDFRNKDVTYCTDPTNPPADTICDQDERAQAAVDVITPSTSLTSTTATASPSTIHANESSTLTFYETNDGTGGTNAQLALSSPNVTTDKPSDCAPAYASGDTNSNSKLDVGETWSFTCSVTPTAAGTFTVTATGHGTIMGRDVTYCTTSDSTHVCDAQEQTSASVTVINPSTALTKTVSADVTYTYSETNDAGDGRALTPPTAGNRSSVVTDDKCSPVTYVSGDTDNDNLLDDGETWVLTCTTTYTGNTDVTNVATGHGKDAVGTDVTYCPAGTSTTGKFCDADERDSARVQITEN